MKSVIKKRDNDLNVLFEVIASREDYKENSENGLVILLNGAWGSGKTTFLNEVKEFIEQSDEYDLFMDYNSYSYDFYENAYLPFFACIEDKIKLGDDFGKLIRSTGKDVIGGIVGISYAIANGIFKSKCNLDLNDLRDNIIGMENDSYLKDFKDFKSCKKEVTKKIKKYCERKPQIIIIDELDRCKPDFAMKTLEIVKHFFDIKNCIFIIAVDKLQLQESAKTIYGQEMDSEKYFSKFFDYQYNLLPLNFNEIIDTSGIEDLNEIINESTKIFNFLKISSRDSKKIFGEFVQKYRKYGHISGFWCIEQSEFIIFLLTLKYVDLLFYSEIMNGNYFKFVKKINNVNNPLFNNYSNLLNFKLFDSLTLNDMCGHLSSELNTTYIDKRKIDNYYGFDENNPHYRKFKISKELSVFIPQIQPNITFRDTIDRIIN